VKSRLIIYKIGCWSYILVGLGHLATSLTTPVTPERAKIIQEMQNFSISMAGTESNLYLFHEGFSLMMGFLLMGYGLMNLSFIKVIKTPPKSLIFINLVMSLIALAISINYFFIVPVVFLGIASFSFLMALILSNKTVNFS